MPGFLKIDKKLLTVCILSLFVPITLIGIYFLLGFVRLTRENELRQAQANVDRIEYHLNEILGKAVDIANRIYMNPRVQEIAAAEYGSLLEIYRAYGGISLFDDYLRSNKEIAGISVYVENPTMVSGAYFIVADDAIRREGWYGAAKAMEGRMFWVYREEAMFRSDCISLVRQIRSTTTGRHLGVLSVNLDMGNLERLCAGEFHDTFISMNGEVICPGGKGGEEIARAGNWVITNSFAPQQTTDSVFDITSIIPQETLFAPVYSMMRRSIAIILVSMVISLALILQIVNQAYIQKLQREQLFSRQKEMQLKILSSQINPHFLYNTLETIRMMALGKKEKKIADTIKMLSRILRQSLSAGEKTVPLATELELVENYLAIQKLRFGGRIHYSVDVDGSAYDYSILPLLIQPLVENSFIHGLETKPGSGYVRIAIETAGNCLCFEVSDNGTGMEPERLRHIQADLASAEGPVGGHIGLVNVNRRIKLHYGEAYGLAISSCPETGTQVRMVLPAVAALPAALPMASQEEIC
jgi:two-component system sensor histidine kinase YesM